MSPNDRTFVFWLPALLLSLYPLSTTLAANASWLPIPLRDIARAAASAVVITLLLLAVLRRVDRGIGSTALWLAAALLPFVAYGWVCDSVGLDKEDWRLAAAYTVLTLMLATVTVRPWQPRRRDPIALIIVSVVMLAANGMNAVLRLPSRPDRERWQQAVDALTTPPDAGTRPGTAPTRDIYYIVVDGFGRPDVLREYYDLDVQPFIDFLQSRGFYVPEQARSNYAQTYLSIASTLNLNYLDGIATAMGTEARDRRPLQRAIRTNAVMTLAHAAGYDVSAITSDYEATLAFDAADRCTCDRFGLSEFEQATISSTPIAALPLSPWTLEAHRRTLEDSFSALATAAATGRRTFVFAHLIAPHPPFVFNADGSRRTTSHTLLGFRDANHFPGSTTEYISGYRAQTQFVVQRLTAILTALLERPGPTPAVVIHGDHGPGATLNWDNPGSDDRRARMAIFAAYRLPDDGPALYSTMTPVNGARALATRYLGVTLPFLPDRSHFSTWMRMFDDLELSSN